MYGRQHLPGARRRASDAARPTPASWKASRAQAVIELAASAGIEVRQTSLTRHDVYVADECFLTGTAAEVIPVVKVDRRVIGSGEPGPVTRKLKERFHELTRA